MQIKIFTIPVFDSNSEEMNKFLRSHRILEVRQEFLQIQNSAYWSFCISYIQGEYANTYKGKKEKVDYKSILDESTFAKFEKLRKIRRDIATKDAVPAYAVFIDAELAEMAKLSDLTENAIKGIKGIGIKRTEKYGKLLVEMYNKDETNGQSDK